MRDEAAVPLDPVPATTTTAAARQAASAMPKTMRRTRFIGACGGRLASGDCAPPVRDRRADQHENGADSRVVRVTEVVVKRLPRPAGGPPRGGEAEAPDQRREQG